jgi:hypothetical protein
MDYNLPNFYQEYSVDPEAFRTLLQSFEEVFGMLNDYVGQIGDDFIINKSGTYKKIPYQRFDAADATYELDDLLLSDIITMQFGLQGLSLTDRINKWKNEFTVKQKMDALDIHGANIMLMSLKDVTGNNNDIPPTIIDFELYDEKNQRMIKNLDYGFRNNILYLFRRLSQRDSTGRRIIIMKDIFLDYNNPEKTLGSYIGIPYDETYTKNEYRDIMESFLYASLGGPTIKNLNESFGTISYEEGFTVYDHKTKDIIKKSFWERRDDGKQLGIYDFLISMPLEAYYNQDKYGIIKKYLDIMKPSYTNYVLSPELTISEKIDMRLDGHETVKNYINAGTIKDKISGSDGIKNLQSARFNDTINNIGTVYYFDDGAICDSETGYLVTDTRLADNTPGIAPYLDKVFITLIPKN